MAFMGMVFVFVIITAFIITPVIMILFKGIFFAVGSLFLKLIPAQVPQSADKSSGRKAGYIILGIVVFSYMLFAFREFFTPLGISLLFLMSSQTVYGRMNKYIVVFLRVLGAVSLITGIVLLVTGYSYKEHITVAELLAWIGG